MLLLLLLFFVYLIFANDSKMKLSTEVINQFQTNNNQIWILRIYFFYLSIKYPHFLETHSRLKAHPFLIESKTTRNKVLKKNRCHHIMKFEHRTSCLSKNWCNRITSSNTRMKKKKKKKKKKLRKTKTRMIPTQEP